MNRIVTLLIFSSLASMAVENKAYKINLNWDDSRTLEDSVTQMCDDTYYSAVEIKVPGRARKDFTVDMDVDITNGKLAPGCTVKRKENSDSVTYVFNAESFCTVRVYQLKPKAGEKHKTATYYLNDAC